MQVITYQAKAQTQQRPLFIAVFRHHSYILKNVWYFVDEGAITRLIGAEMSQGTKEPLRTQHGNDFFAHQVRVTVTGRRVRSAVTRQRAQYRNALVQFAQLRGGQGRQGVFDRIESHGAPPSACTY